jgi:hypothetical protein
MQIAQARYRRINTLTAWGVFITAFIVYGLTVEPTTSFWDCGEYIACAWGIEVGHPPGAPLFLLLGRLAGLLSFGNNENVALMINLLSATASAFTIFFLHLSITALAKKAMLKSHSEGQFEFQPVLLTQLAGIAGALSFAFTDTFWFSAVEGEVYALSSLFTAIVVWAMLRWDAVADEPQADRWLIFIAYMMGLSVGVHLLNLLCIPALVFIWYYRKYKTVTRLGLLITGIVAVVLLGGIQNVLIPGVVNLCGKTELFFVNKLGMPFNSGTIAYFGLLTLVLVGGIAFTQFRKMAAFNTALLALTTLLIGYSSFFILIIRAQASPPINENNTSNAVSLLSYLNREQYGDWPLLYGRTYATPLDKEKPWIDGKPVYVRNDKARKYVVSYSAKASEPNYEKRACMFFPRMWSGSHAAPYKSITGEPRDSVDLSLAQNGSEVVKLPSVAQNLKYFTAHQLGWMYGRYFLWNFAGRQNDRMSGGNDAEGNVSLGGFLDDRLGKRKLQPERQRNNKAANRYYLIPLLLGVAGMFWHFKNAGRDAFITLLLFLFTGVAIAVYLNMTPWQPRERDYAFVGSFYAFSIWIGIGILFVGEQLAKLKLSPKTVMTGTVVFSLISPLILIQQNYNDHNRSGRTAARDFAVNLLESCEQNAILITYADNDTFTLWFAQEVLGIRRDVRVVCLSLLPNDWYIDQMKKKQYTSDPLPITMDHEMYKQGKRDFISVSPATESAIATDSLIRFATSKRKGEFFTDSYGDTSNFIPSRNTYITVDKSAYAKTATVSAEKMRTASDSIFWTIGGNYIMKDQLVILDIIAHNNWKRPIYFAPGMPGSSYYNLNNYLEAEGMAWRLTPFYHNDEDHELTTDPACNTEKSYNLMMQKYAWGGLKNPNVYADETVERMFIDPMRESAAVVASALIGEGKTAEAALLIKRCVEELPHTQAAPDDKWLALCVAAFGTGDKALAEKTAKTAFKHATESVRWYSDMHLRPGDYYTQINIMEQLYGYAVISGNKNLADEFYTKAAPYTELGIPENLMPDTVEKPAIDSMILDTLSE